LKKIHQRGTADFELGDRVYLLLGCSLPVLLKLFGIRNEELFKMTDDYYTYAIMYGGAFGWFGK
jgi:hypothetical protein